MQIDAVVIGTIASVVITIVVGAVIGYNVIKKWIRSLITNNLFHF